MPFRTTFFALVAAQMFCAQAQAQALDSSPHSDARLIAENLTVRQGEPFEVGLLLTMESGWHSYWKNPGDAGMPTEVQWRLPAGFEAEPIQWPFPERIDQPPLASYGFSDEVLLPIRVIPPAEFSGSSLVLEGKAAWLICADICLPAEQEVSLPITVSDSAPAPDPEWAELFAQTRAAFPRAVRDWRPRVKTTDSGYQIIIRSASGRVVDLTGAFFFADEPGVVQHAEEQLLTHAGEGSLLNLARSEFAESVPDRLSGALVLADGATWDGVHRALLVDAPLEGAPAPAPAVDGAQMSLFVALLFAFIGGLILNLMPCVFPILSIKILGFAQGRERSKAVLRNHGLLFALGVIVSFLLLAATLLVLRAGGEQLGWGFQLQSPWLIGALALLMFGLGLMLLGVFEAGLGLAGAGGRLDNRQGLGGAFWSGVLATVVATPCTAPFMGVALGYALGQPAIYALLVFAFLGAGMALPYLLLSLFPQWIQRLPKPGRWMETLKQALAFPLFATAVWLVWVFGLQTGIDGAAYLMLATTLLGFGAWVYGRWSLPNQPPGRRRTARVVVGASMLLAVACVGQGARQDATGQGDVETDAVWRPFDPTEIERLVAAGTPVFVDFTAAWCLSCQANKAVALSADAVDRAFREKGVVRFRADWTQRDPAITAALESFGRSGVPLYVLYRPGFQPTLLPEILTAGIMTEALDLLPTPIVSGSDPNPSIQTLPDLRNAP